MQKMSENKQIAIFAELICMFRETLFKGNFVSMDSV